MMSNNIPQNTVEVSSVYTYKELSIDKLKYEYEITVGSDYIKQKGKFQVARDSRKCKITWI